MQKPSLFCPVDNSVLMFLSFFLSYMMNIIITPEYKKTALLGIKVNY